MAGRIVNGELRALEAAIAAIDRDELPEVLGQLARLAALARLRYSVAVPASRPASNGSVPQMRAASWVAERLSNSEAWVYEHREELGGLKLSERCVRFSDPFQSIVGSYSHQHGVLAAGGLGLDGRNSQYLTDDLVNLHVYNPVKPS